MRFTNWKTWLLAWGIVALAFGFAIWPRHVEPNPFLHVMSDEQNLAARVGVVWYAFALWVLPPVLLWAVVGLRGRTSS